MNDSQFHFHFPKYECNSGEIYFTQVTTRRLHKHPHQPRNLRCYTKPVIGIQPCLSSATAASFDQIASRLHGACPMLVATPLGQA